jgi:hypothetical protein
VIEADLERQQADLNQQLKRSDERKQRHKGSWKCRKLYVACGLELFATVQMQLWQMRNGL